MREPLIKITDEGTHYLYRFQDKAEASIVFCRGGFQNTPQNMGLCRLLSRQGWEVLAVKYGNAYSLTDDVRYTWLATVKAVNKPYILGISRGGYLAANAIERSRYQGAVICVAPLYPDEWQEKARLPKDVRPYFNLTPVFDNVPMLLIYGKRDKAVPSTQGAKFYKEHKDSGLVKFVCIDDSHTLMHREEGIATMLWWLKKQVRNASR